MLLLEFCVQLLVYEPRLGVEWEPYLLLGTVGNSFVCLFPASLALLSLGRHMFSSGEMSWREQRMHKRYTSLLDICKKYFCCVGDAVTWNRRPIFNCQHFFTPLLCEVVL